MKDIIKELTSNLTLYDHIGYLFVGTIGLFLIGLDLFLWGGLFGVVIWDNLPTRYISSLNLGTFLGWFIVAYFLGHLIQAIANVFVREPVDQYSESEMEILDMAKAHFQLDKQSNKDIFQFCYMTAAANDTTGLVAIYLAHYGLYRGWYILFSLESIFLAALLLAALLIIQLYHWSMMFLFVFPVISILIALLFKRRATRFYKYFRGTVLQTFTILKKTMK